MKSFRKPQVVYKPKPPITKLSDKHALHLDNLANGGLMRTVTPPDVEESLLQAGYARKAVGGLMLTDMGHRALLMYQKEMR